MCSSFAVKKMMITAERNTTESSTYKRDKVIEAYNEVMVELQQSMIGGRRENLTTLLSKADIYERVRVKVGFYDSIQTISKIVRAYLKEQKRS